MALAYATTQTVAIVVASVKDGLPSSTGVVLAPVSQEENNVTQMQILGILRAIAAPLFAFAIGKNWIHAGDADWIMASAATVGTAAWSAWTNRPVAIVIEAKKVIAADPALIDKVASKSATI